MVSLLMLICLNMIEIFIIYLLQRVDVDLPITQQYFQSTICLSNNFIPGRQAVRASILKKIEVKVEFIKCRYI